MAADYETLFGPVLADIENEMRAARRDQTEIAPIAWAIIDYQFGWDLGPDQLALYRKVTGKKIRPLLMALVAKAICGRYDHVLPAGAALEMIHNFTLIHDDVMDKSLERRHRPAVWMRWGSAQAINGGDALYALGMLASARLLNRDIPAEKVVASFRALSQACLWTAEGQMLDIDFEARDSVTTDEYITMITHKSATLIECAAKVGALLSTDEEPIIQAYAQFARHLGIAFQVRDDYLGVWGDEGQTGKSTTSDIREKKKAYPILAALERASDRERATLRQIYAQDRLSDDDIQTVLGIMEAAGAAEQTNRIAEDYFTAALRYLDSTGIQNETQDLIRRFAAFLIRRVY